MWAFTQEPLRVQAHKKKGGRMEVHNFVPFNSYSALAEFSRFEKFVKEEGYDEEGCSEMFAPEEEVLEGFLDYGWDEKGKVGRWLLPTGCIQEVHVAQGESALDAFHRWRWNAERRLVIRIRWSATGVLFLTVSAPSF